MSIRVGVAPGPWIWNSGGSSFFNFVAAWEDLGWDSCWLSDKIISDRPNLEAVTALAAVAAKTKTVMVGTSVIALAVRNPVVLA